MLGNLLGGMCLSLNWMAASNINLDEAIQASFSGSACTHARINQVALETSLYPQ
jgi:hypothetical protein